MNRKDRRAWARSNRMDPATQKLSGRGPRKNLGTITETIGDPSGKPILGLTKGDQVKIIGKPFYPVESVRDRKKTYSPIKQQLVRTRDFSVLVPTYAVKTQ